MQINESIENYLERILMLHEKKGYAKSIDIASELMVTKPSVSHAMKILRENDYILMDKDNYITLTDSGMQIAKRIYDRHRILSEFLVRLGVSEDVARADACKIEHDISEETFEAICKHAGVEVPKRTI